MGSSNRPNNQVLETGLSLQVEKLRAEVFRSELVQSASVWTEPEQNDIAKAKRMEKSLKDFWFFSKTYFPPEKIKDYAPFGKLHKDIHSFLNIPGVHFVVTDRNFAKTSIALQLRIWQMLRGDVTNYGIFCKTDVPAKKLLYTFLFILTENPRIKSDFETELISKEEFYVFKSIKNPLITISTFTLKRSPKGTSIGGKRLDACDMDDLQTADSNFDQDNFDDLLDLIDEAYRSCYAGSSSCFYMANSMHPKDAFSRLLKMHEKRLVNVNFHLHPYPAYSKKRTELVRYTGPLWKERYPAKSEKEMKEMLSIGSQHDWMKAQMTPQIRSGTLFPEANLQTYNIKDLPNDAYGPAYCDPNNSKKNKGDTTCFGGLLFSPTTNKFYAHKVRNKSYSNPNDLLSDYLNTIDAKINVGGMDGHVSQESIWISNINNWCLLHKRPYPRIVFKRYSVDAIVDQVRYAYLDNRILFEEGFIASEEGQTFKEQLFGFQGKSAGKRDDAPDWLACVYWMGIELGYYTPSGGESIQTKTFSSKLSF